VLETFLFDFDGDLYGKEIEIEFIDFLRPDQGFHSADALKAQMDADCAKARQVLDAVEAAGAQVPRSP
jgi:riboflavin kinase / FMN adenylyltransferase